jgi:hypothetical protein
MPNYFVLPRLVQHKSSVRAVIGSHRGLRWDEATIWLHPASPHHAWCSVRVCFKKLYTWSCFVKRFTKTAPAPSMELFMELKPPKIASLAKWSHAKRGM